MTLVPIFHIFNILHCLSLKKNKIASFKYRSLLFLAFCKRNISQKYFYVSLSFLFFMLYLFCCIIPYDILNIFPSSWENTGNEHLLKTNIVSSTGTNAYMHFIDIKLWKYTEIHMHIYFNHLKNRHLSNRVKK